MNNSPFSSGSEWWYNAIIGHGDQGHENRWHRYADGYKLAAESLCAQVLEMPKSIDYYVYPIIFLYRHYIELRLKEILEQGCVLLDEEFSLPKHHDIKICWDRVKPIVQRIWPDDEPHTLNQMEQIIISIHAIDKKSDAFRYPIDKKLNPNLREIQFINLKDFSEAVKPLTDNLDGMILSIRTAVYDKSEMLREFDSYVKGIEEEINSYLEPYTFEYLYN